MLVNTQGFAVMDERDQPIVFAPNETQIEVSPDGTISTENGRVARIKVVKFDNDQKMRKAGDSLFETTQDPEPVQTPHVAQGMMEESNIQPVMEMTRMTQILREYQGVQKMLDAEHERQLKAIQTLGVTKTN